MSKLTKKIVAAIILALVPTFAGLVDDTLGLALIWIYRALAAVMIIGWSLIQIFDQPKD